MKMIQKISMVFFILFFIQKGMAQTYKIDLSKSIIKWEGKKITGQHEGTLNFKEGFLIFKDNKITGGNFIVDMKSLNNTDQTGGPKTKLEGHLKSEDFFGVENFTTATLQFKSIANKEKNTYLINADLTIKGITSSIQFDLIVGKNKATAFLKINRTKYDIKYGSGSYFDDLGDKTIYDDFELNVILAY
jgi:polyisoprenoid-binding protein YceI